MSSCKHVYAGMLGVDAVYQMHCQHCGIQWSNGPLSYRLSDDTDAGALRAEIARLTAELAAAKAERDSLRIAWCGDIHTERGRKAYQLLRAEAEAAFAAEVATLNARIEAGIAAAQNFECLRCDNGLLMAVDMCSRPTICGVCGGSGRDTSVARALRGEP